MPSRPCKKPSLAEKRRDIKAVLDDAQASSPEQLARSLRSEQGYHVERTSGEGPKEAPAGTIVTTEDEYTLSAELLLHPRRRRSELTHNEELTIEVAPSAILAAQEMVHYLSNLIRTRRIPERLALHTDANIRGAYECIFHRAVPSPEEVWGEALWSSIARARRLRLSVERRGRSGLPALSIVLGEASLDFASNPPTIVLAHGQRVAVRRGQIQKRKLPRAKKGAPLAGELTDMAATLETDDWVEAETWFFADMPHEIAGKSERVSVLLRLELEEEVPLEAAPRLTDNRVVFRSQLCNRVTLLPKDSVEEAYDVGLDQIQAKRFLRIESEQILEDLIGGLKYPVELPMHLRDKRVIEWLVGKVSLKSGKGQTGTMSKSTMLAVVGDRRELARRIREDPRIRKNEQLRTALSKLADAVLHDPT